MMSATVKKNKLARRYGEEFKREAVELLLHSGKTHRQVARELDISEPTLNHWKKAYLGQQRPAEVEGQMKSPEEMAKIIGEQHKEIEYLKRQREILKKAMSILGEEPPNGMR
jgi:transposase